MNREKIITALLSGDLRELAVVSGKDYTKFHFFYTSADNITVIDG